MDPGRGTFRGHDLEVQGFAATSVDNGLVGLTIVPELGAKLSSLRDLRTGQEWLWTSDRVPYARHPDGAPYVAVADCGGWDECFPTVAPCPPVDGWAATLPDHGQMWSRPWLVAVELGEEVATVRADVEVAEAGYRFSRTITVPAGEPRLHMAYRLTDSTGADRPFVWSAHPLFAVAPGMGVELPAGARLRVFSTADGTTAEGPEPLAWPVAAHGPGGRAVLDAVPPLTAGVALKLWTAPLGAGATAALHGPSGSLRFHLGDGVDQLGLWVNAGGWTGIGGDPYFNLALEPCIGAQDSLHDAVTVESCAGHLPGGGAVEWSMDVVLTAGAAA